MTDQSADYTGWVGRQVNDSAGDKLGKVHAIYLDDQTSQPEWLAVSTGMFSKRSSFVPLSGTHSEADVLVVAYTKDKIKDAPQVDEESEGHLSPAEEDELYRYYEQGTTTATTGTADVGTGVVEQAGTRGAGHDTSGPNTDDAMTRSEERLNVGTRTQESGRARLRKYVVTEQQTRTVPVSHEEVRVEREPITDANLGAATDGPAISEEEHEVVLHEERPVAEKEVVPVERVRLSKETVSGDETVAADLRSEQIEEEGVDTSPDQRR